MIESFNAVDERELHKSFNMGIGLVLIVDKENVNEIVDYINTTDEKAYIIGEVVDTHEGVELC